MTVRVADVPPGAGPVWWGEFVDPAQRPAALSRSPHVEPAMVERESGAFDASWSFVEYVEHRLDGLLRHAMTLTADAHDAQDVVQAVLERVLVRWEAICGLQAPDGYVRRMLVNESISRHRRAARVLLRARSDEGDVEPDPQSDAAVAVTRRDELVTGIRRLPPRQRVAISLRYFHDLTDAQIAAEMGCTESTVRGYVLRALRTLRLELDQEDR